MKNADDRALSHLGLCKRAGKLVSGEEIVLQAVRDQSAKLVILSNDVSVGTEKKVRDKCTYYQTPIVQRFDRYTIGASIGQEARVVLAVVDEGFAKMIQNSFSISTEVSED